MGHLFIPLIEKELKDVIATQLINSNDSIVMKEYVTTILTWENILSYDFLRTIFKRYYDRFPHVI